ncbi:MAG: DUF2341 domain-containing protein [Candidatus Cloacimonetes bacterium]|nr:DUF2341 domain-containing protein [Candidatus Cloacimonadota bacterium]
MNKRIVLLIVLLVLGVTAGYAVKNGDYRSRQTGLWKDKSTWQRRTASAWYDLSLNDPPVTSDGVVTIRSPHVVTITESIVIDEVIIELGATLNIASTVTVQDGPGSDITNNGTLNIYGTLTSYQQQHSGNKSYKMINGPTGVVNIEGGYSFLHAFENQGVLNLGDSQLTGQVTNKGTIKSDRVDIMYGAGTLEHETGSTVEFTSVVTIPEGENYQNLNLSAPGIYYLEGDVAVNGTINLGPNTYLHTNGHILSDGAQGVHTGDHIIYNSIVTLTTSTPAVAVAYMSQSATKHPIYKFALNRDSMPGEVNISGLTFTTTGSVNADDIIYLQLWGGAIDNINATGASPIATASSSWGNNSGSHRFTFDPYALNASSVRYFWITADVEAEAIKDRTITVNALNQSNFTISDTATLIGVYEGVHNGGLQTISTINTVLSSLNQVPAQGISTSSKKNPVYHFQLLSSGDNALTGLSFTGTGITNTNFSKFELYASTTDNLAIVTDPISTFQVSEAIPGTFSFTDFNYKLLSRQKYYFWITVDVNVGANVDNSITINALTIDNIFLTGDKSGSATIGGTQTIVDPGTTLSSDNPAIPPATISRGSNKNPIYAFNLTSSGSNTFKTVTFKPNGDNLAANVSKYQLYSSTSNFFGSATQVGSDITTITASGETVSFSGLNHTLTDGITRYYWITADIKADATVNNAITVTALAATDIIMEIGTNPDSDTAHAGGTQSIGYPLLEVRTHNPAIPAGTVNVGSPRNPIYRFTVVRDDAIGTVKISTLTFQTSGTYNANNLERFRLGRSAVDNCTTANPVDQVGITSDLGPGTHTFTFNPPLEFTQNSTSFFWISAVTEQAIEPGSGNNIQISALNDASFGVTDNEGRVKVSAHAGAVQTIGDVKVYLEPNSGVLEVSPFASGQKKRAIQSFTLNSCGNVTVDEIRFNTTGTYSYTDISRFQLWTGIENDLSSAAQISTDISTGLGVGTHEFKDIGLALSPGQIHYLWITADASSSPASSKTINISALSASDITPSFATPTGYSDIGAEQTFSNTCDWTHAQSQTINSIANAGSGYQVKVVVHSGDGSDNGNGENVYVGNNSRGDFGDIRFFEGDLPLSYWMESCDYGSKATFWVKLNSNLSFSFVNLTMRYGNKGATTTSDGNATFEFFDDFNRTDNSLDKWNKHKTMDKSTIDIPKGLNHVRLGDCGTSGDYGHVVLGSDKTYNNFTNGAIEFRYRVCVDAIAEIGFRGTFGNPGLGYKGRSDARVNTETQNGGQSFLSPPYYGWEHLSDSMDSFSNQPIPHTWYVGTITAFNNELSFYRDDHGNIKLAGSHQANYHGAGEISLQNHYGNKADFDWVFVRKFANVEPTRGAWKSSPMAKEATAINYNGFTARWYPCPNSVKYYFDVLQADGNTYVSKYWENREVTTNIIRVEGLTANTIYRYRVRSECSNGIVSPNSNLITAITGPATPGYGTTTIIGNAEATTVYIPLAAGFNSENSNVVITPAESVIDEDVVVVVTYLPDGYEDTWPNARLLASISSTNPNALNGAYNIPHEGITMPQSAAYRYAGGDWHYLDSEYASFNDTYTVITISGITGGRASGALEIVMDDGSGTLPVELSSFTARLNPYGKVKIEWVTQTETNAMGYRIYRNNVKDLDSALLLDGLIEGRNTSHTQVYTYIDNDILEPGNNYYWLECVDYDGTAQYYGPMTVTINGDSDTNNQIPIVAGINHTYPNPFNPDVHITFGVPEDTTVKLMIYNIKGQFVSEILSENFKRGTHTFTWTGRDARGRQLSSGLYFLRMEMDKKTWIKKIVMSK